MPFLGYKADIAWIDLDFSQGLKAVAGGTFTLHMSLSACVYPCFLAIHGPILVTLCLSS